MGLLILWAIILIGFFSLILYKKAQNGICKSKRKLDGMTCVVTGGTSGIGLEISIDYARRGARVIIACPFEEEGINAEKMIIQKTGNNKVVFKLLDLASFKSVRKFAADILNKEERLDILMNNAGVACPGKESDDGMNIVMQVNYLGHFLLTLLLLPILKKSGTPLAPSRIVNTSSVQHRLAILDVDNLAVSKDNLFGKSNMYSSSKLCLILFSRELTKRLKHSNVVINNADPGEVATRIFLKDGYITLYVMFLMCSCFGKNSYEGAQTPLHIALDVEAGQKSGLFYRDCQPCEPAKVSNDEELAKKLWDKSVELVKLGDKELKELLQ